MFLSDPTGGRWVRSHWSRPAGSSVMMASTWASARRFQSAGVLLV
jgi:hypothetical protein